ncbi:MULTISPECIES: monovalent cation/H+ antiporter complex subunit F [Stutzerimonas stutzeri subgroup]|uniref:Potassium efflux system protein n=1 Tax=Stutzerimonas stutzeri CCUG 29243 TaxID=1196835 RepID=I4CYF9_STUST|nr:MULTISPECIES: monovalent cation/H+ antiporter complex subunit F [Stutzerimonas stutzeri subgroup]AFM35116.1 potassium efflux system protein [Stutzerimonas stutzeri CCUG 29243]MCQ2039973.1 monovalent cation/H+ antiporter complex subunit F [Stutzerimonas kunmingensis]
MAVFCALLLLTLIIGLWRVLLGPRRVDRLLAVQLFGTTGAALLLVLAQWQGAPALRDAALVLALLALLAAMISAALVQLLRRSRHE